MSDQPARDIAISDHKTTILVEAGAGTGKTTLLIDRICALIEAGVDVEKIAAVTFTVKAAGEMKERLRQALRKRSESPFARKALSDLDRMLINTIHGLASELLRTLPVEAQLPPGFSALDELQQDVARDEFLTRWLIRALNSDTPPALRVAEELGLKLRDSQEDRTGKRDLVQLFAKLNSVPDELDRVTAHAQSSPSLDDALEVLDQRVSVLRVAASTCPDGSDKFLIGLQNLFQWHESRPKNLVTVDGARWIAEVPKASYGKVPNWGGADRLNDLKDIAKEIHGPVAAGIREALASIVIQEITTWISPAVREFRRSLPETGLVGFDDLLHLCRSMLKRSRIARSHFKNRFEHLHIDEFQDTDPVQVEILFYLAEVESDFGDDWQTMRLKPGKLFIVGDPKQSIYGFRGADIRIYDRVAERIAQTGKVLHITRNFRSRAEILTEVNAVFKTVMARPVDGQPVYSALEPARPDKFSWPAVELLAPPSNYNAVEHDAASASRAEADAIAKHLHTMRDKGELADWSAAAVLLRASTHLPVLQEVFTARSIPFISFLNESYTGRVEIEAALTLLTALGNPQHTVAVIGALRSPWFAISDDELFRHKFAGGSFVYTEPQSFDTQVGSALVTLARWRALALKISAADLFESILCENPFEVHYGLKSEGTQRVQNIATLTALIRRLEAGGVVGLQALVARLVEIKKLEQSTELEARDKDRQAVQLLTLHKAKGLEFPVVVLFKMRDSQPKHDEWFLEKSLDGGPHQLAVSYGNKGFWRTTTCDACYARSDAQFKAEEQRLQYVGMTRARDRLILPLGWAGKKESSPEQHLPAVLLARYYDKITKRVTSNETSAVLTVSPAIDPVNFRPYQPRIEDLSLDQPSASESHWINWQTSRAARLAQLAPEPVKESAAPAVVDWSRLHAQRVGTAVHAALERLIRRADPDSIIRFVTQRFALSESEAADVAGLVKTATESPLFTSELPRARRVFTELPVISQQPSTESANYVDLLFQDDAGRWIIIDFKTDDITRELARETADREHRTQLMGYARLFERLSGEQPAEIRVFFLRPAEIVVF